MCVDLALDTDRARGQAAKPHRGRARFPARLYSSASRGWPRYRWISAPATARILAPSRRPGNCPPGRPSNRSVPRCQPAARLPPKSWPSCACLLLVRPGTRAQDRAGGCGTSEVARTLGFTHSWSGDGSPMSEARVPAPRRRPQLWFARSSCDQDRSRWRSGRATWTDQVAPRSRTVMAAEDVRPASVLSN